MAQQQEQQWEKFSIEQVSASPDLMVHQGWVLDVSRFMADHPGGAAYLERWVGRDISEIFEAETPHRHSAYATKVLETLRVGKLLGATTKDNTNDRVLEKLVDVNKPFLFQMGQLEEKYHPWMTSQPVVRKLTIFPWGAIEALSRYPWWWIWVGMPPLLVLGVVTAVQENISVGAGLFFYMMGLVMWVFMEYTLHRWVFHLETSTYGWNIFHFFAHGLHHLTPHDTTRLTFPPVFTFVLAFLFWNLCKYICFDQPGYSLLFSGLVTGYIAYDTTHFLYHHTDGSSYGSIKFPLFFTRYLRFMKSHHNTHHFLNEDCNFGVSSPLLDFVFGTYMSKRQAEALREKRSKIQ